MNAPPPSLPLHEGEMTSYPHPRGGGQEVGIGVDVAVAAERSAVYRTLADAFRYPGIGANAVGISGVEYNDAFDPGVNAAAVSLREGAHIEDDQSALFEELMRFYEFFGLRRGEAVEMPDHISVELEFMHYLTHLEAQATKCTRSATSIRRAQRDFIERHLSRLLGGLQNALDERHGKCFELVNDCAAFITSERAHLDAHLDE